MPKATLSFNLPEENFDFKAATAGADSYSLLEELRETIRNHLKHGGREDVDVLDAVYERICNYTFNFED